jgi:hypothetical protein
MKKEGKFFNPKIISLILFVVGVFVSIALWVNQTKIEQRYWVNALTYSFKNPITGETVYNSGSYIGEMSLFQFASSEYMNSAIWVETIVAFAVFVVLGILVYAFYAGEELIITDSGIKGKAIRGKVVEYNFPQITSVKKSGLKGVTVITTGQEKIKFRLLKNQADIIEAVANKVASGKSRSPVVAAPSGSVADQLEAYKKLLDTGVISQEEFDAMKKQLLGL